MVLLQRGKTTSLIASMIWAFFFSLWSYGFWLPSLFPFQSNRIIVSTVGLFMIGWWLCFLVLTRVIVPGMRNLPLLQKKWVVTCSVVLGVYLFISVVDFNTLVSRYTYFLIPKQSVEIFGLAESGSDHPHIAIRRFATSVGDTYFSQLEVNNWVRDDLDVFHNKLVLENIQGNYIKWSGRTGVEAAIHFETSPLGGKVEVTWNGVKRVVNLNTVEPGVIEVSHEFTIPWYAGWIPLAIFIFLNLSAAMLTLILFVINSKIITSTIQSKRFDWLKYALVIALAWSLYWVTYYPGIMTVDSFNQWRQMVTGQFVDWHPPFHTLTNWLITRVWYSPAAIAAVQVLTLSSVLGWGIAVMRRAGAPAWLAWVTAGMMAISPANGVLSVSIWKDIAFSIAVTALSIQLFQIVLSRGKWLEEHHNWLAFGVVLALTAIYRQNGLLVSAGGAIAVLITFRKQWKMAVLGFVLFLVLWGGVKEGLYRVIQVAPNQTARLQKILLNNIAAQQDAGTPLLLDEEKLIEEIFPSGHLPYFCYKNKELTSSVDTREISTMTLELARTALRLDLIAPMVTLRHFACNGAFVYRMAGYLDYYEMASLTNYQNEFGFEKSSLIPNFEPYITAFIINSTMNQNGWFHWILWRSSFWLYFLVSGCISFCLRRKSGLYLLVLIPALLVALPLILVSLGQIFRYTYPVYLSGMLFGLYYWFMAMTQLKED